GGLRATARIEAIEIPSLVRHALLPGRMPQFSPSGHLVFAQDDKLWAVAFDAGRLAVNGSPMVIAESLRSIANIPLFAVGRDGSLAFVPGTTSQLGTVVWIDRAGKSAPVFDNPEAFEIVRLSPNGAEIAANALSPEGSDLWVYDIQRGTRLRLTTKGNN